MLSNSENVSINNSVLNDFKANRINYYSYGDRDERVTTAAPLNFKATQQDVFQKRALDTGLWLLESPEFNAWLVGLSETLWCPGIPGAGKTVLASIVVNHIRMRLMQDSPGIACIYCYCNYKDQQRQTVSELIASLLKQLVQDNPRISEYTKTLYDHHIVRNTRPVHNELTDALRSEVGRYAKVFIIVDALDEFLERDQGRLITELQSLASTVNLMVTSRPLPMIEQQFRSARRLHILANDEDIRKYIENRIPHERRLLQHVKKDGTLLESIMGKVGTTAKGMFLLAELDMNTLGSKSNSRAVRTALEYLPTEMNAMYKEAMERITGQGEDDRQLAERVLTWIIYAFRPLSLRELQHALSIYPNTTTIDSEALEDDTIFISVCAGLVVLDEKSHFIRLIHYTAQQYFESKRESLFPNGPAYISRTCLTYLSFNQFGKDYDAWGMGLKSLLESSPLLEYAAMHWGHHTRGHVEETNKEAVLNFLQKRENVICAGQVLLTDGMGLVSGYLRPLPTRFSDMHILSFFGLEKILFYRIQMGALVDLTDDNGRTPLWYAAKNGHEAVVRLLTIRNDVNVNFGSPLSYAAENGRKKVVELLLARNDINVNSGDEYDRWPLILATGNGHEAIVRLLLAREDVELNHKTMFGRTPLSSAAMHRHREVVRLLLAEAKIDVNSRDEMGYSALSLAAQSGHEEIVRVLLAHDDIELNCKTRYGWTPLSLAAENGHSEVVRLLLAEAEIDINSHDRWDYYPLMWAAKNGHDEVVRLLVARDDINLNYRNILGDTPLSLAVELRHEQVAKLIIYSVCESDI